MGRELRILGFGKPEVWDVYTSVVYRVALISRHIIGRSHGLVL